MNYYGPNNALNLRISLEDFVHAEHFLASLDNPHSYQAVLAEEARNVAQANAVGFASKR